MGGSAGTNARPENTPSTPSNSRAALQERYVCFLFCVFLSHSTRTYDICRLTQNNFPSLFIPTGPVSSRPPTREPILDTDTAGLPPAKKPQPSAWLFPLAALAAPPRDAQSNSISRASQPAHLPPAFTQPAQVGDEGPDRAAAARCALTAAALGLACSAAALVSRSGQSHRCVRCCRS
jgi:hypothetical protein